MLCLVYLEDKDAENIICYHSTYHCLSILFFEAIGKHQVREPLVMEVGMCLFPTGLRSNIPSASTSSLSGSLTALLIVVYVGLVIGLGALVRLFTGQVSQSPAIIVASTLAVAALFEPLRHRIQAIIDQCFYRRKYDAAKTLEAFSTTLRQEVDLDQLREQLLTVIQETMQPAHVSLWLRKSGSESKSNIQV